VKLIARIAAAVCCISVVQAAELIPTPDDPILGDVNGDGAVDSQDMAIVLTNYSLSGRLLRIHGDLNFDGSVDLLDLNEVLLNMSETQPSLPLAMDVELRDGNDDPPPGGTVTNLGNVYDVNAANETIRIFRDFDLVDTTAFAPDPMVSQPLAPTITAAWQDDGVDLTVVYDNTNRGYAVHPSAVRLAIFDRTVQRKFHDFSRGGMLTDFEYNESNNAFGPMEPYPGRLYAPVAVFESHDAGYAVGVSVKFPSVELQRPIYFYRPDTVGANGIVLWILPSPDAPNIPHNPDLDIPPGQQLSFEISVRVREIDFTTAAPGEWMHTLRPYRRFYRHMYGGVRYVRRPEQVKGIAMTQGDQWDEQDNPWGYRNVSSPQRRPDWFGFGPWRSVLDGHANIGWERLMIWSVSGIYPNPAFQSSNYPPQFTSNLTAVLAAAAADTTHCNPCDTTLDPLSTYADDTGGTLGLWWGHSSHYPTNPWPLTASSSPPGLVVYDENNSTHVAFRHNELDGAVDLNAAEVGLDAFPAGGQWARYWTLQDDIANYPGIRFITETEPAIADFIHTLAPTFNRMTKAPGSTSGELFELPEGVPIFDFLNPGHEVWGQIDRAHLVTKSGIPTGQFDPEDAQPFIEAVAALGIVPCYFGDGPAEVDPEDYDAVESWLETVPCDLQ
jgi:hypothetical protein